MYVCMYVWMYVCMYECMYVCMYEWMYVCMNVCMYVCIYVWMYVCMYECMYVWMNVCMYLCMNVCMYEWMYVCMYVCMDVCMNRMHSLIWAPQNGCLTLRVKSWVSWLKDQPGLFHVDVSELIFFGHVLNSSLDCIVELNYTLIEEKAALPCRWLLCNVVPQW